MATGHERRLQLRFSLPAEDRPTAVLDRGRAGPAATALVHDLSLSGAGLRVAESQQLDDADSWWLELCDPALPLGQARAELIHVRELGQGQELVGVRFQSAEERFLRELSHYLVTTDVCREEQRPLVEHPRGFEEVHDPRRIRRILMHCCRRQRPLRVLEGPRRAAGTVVAMTVGQECFTVRLDPLAQRMLSCERPCCLLVPSFTGLYLLTATVLGIDNDRAILSLPERMLAGGVRRVGRVAVDAEFPIWLEFLHPQLPGKLLRKPACEVGLGGLRFALDLDEDLLARGSVIESAVLRLPGGHALPCRGIVRHTSRSESGYQCGVELLSFAGEGRQVWVKKVLSRMNPNVYEATAFKLKEVWEVFERSGYLDEKPADLLQSMREPFVTSWRRLLNEREGSRCWLYRTEGQALGTVCASRIYTNTWIIHHLAVDRVLGAGQKLLLVTDLFPRTAFQWLAGIAPEGNIVGYFNAHKAFNQGAWVKFLREYRGPGATDVQEAMVRDYDLTGPVPLVWPGDLLVRRAGPDDLAWVAADLQQRDGEFLCQALDYVADRLLLDEKGKPEGWAALGRSRAIFVVEQGARPVGYAMLEHAAPGLNIYSLYDSCRVIVLLPAEDPRYTQARNLLFSEVARHHARDGRTSLLYWKGLQDAAPPDWEPFIDLPLIRAVFQADAVSAWVEYLHELWTQR